MQVQNDAITDSKQAVDAYHKCSLCLRILQSAELKLNRFHAKFRNKLNLQTDAN